MISTAIPEIVGKMKPYMKKNAIILNTAKALGANGSRYSEIINEILSDYDSSVGMFAGGTIAKDLFHAEPLGADVAFDDLNIAEKVKTILESDNLKIRATDDLIGVEYAAAFKNVIAILAGVVKGAGFSFGSETHFISRASKEVCDLVEPRSKMQS